MPIMRSIEPLRSSPDRRRPVVAVEQLQDLGVVLSGGRGILGPKPPPFSSATTPRSIGPCRPVRRRRINLFMVCPA